MCQGGAAGAPERGERSDSSPWLLAVSAIRAGASGGSAEVFAVDFTG